MADQLTSTEERNAVLAEYGQAYFENYWGGGGPYERNERWLKFFGTVADGIVRDLHPSSALDAGCAMGFLVEELRRRGVDAWGIDVSEYAISQVDESVGDRCSVASLTDPLTRRYDLITCIEVVEHIPPAETEIVVANLCAATDQLLLSTTPQDYGEPTHLNVQPPEAWSAALARQGFFRDLERDFSYLSPWAGLYRRTEEPVAETVRRYDRAWWRLRREASEVRSSLLEMQERLAALEDSGPIERRTEIQKALDHQREEVLRLRDLLISKDRELGNVRGQLAVLHGRAHRLSNLLALTETRAPGVMRLVRSVVRRLRGRRSQG